MVNVDTFIVKEHFVFYWINIIFTLCKLPLVQSFVSLSKSSGYRGECEMYIAMDIASCSEVVCIIISAASLCCADLLSG